MWRLTADGENLAAAPAAPARLGGAPLAVALAYVPGEDRLAVANRDGAVSIYDIAPEKNCGPSTCPRHFNSCCRKLNLNGECRFDAAADSPSLREEMTKRWRPARSAPRPSRRAWPPSCAPWSLPTPATIDSSVTTNHAKNQHAYIRSLFVVGTDSTHFHGFVRETHSPDERNVPVSNASAAPTAGHDTTQAMDRNAPMRNRSCSDAYRIFRRSPVVETLDSLSVSQ